MAVLGELVSKALCLSLAFSALVTGKAGTKCTISGQSSPTAVTSQGAYRGSFDSAGNSVFLGIPFAATTGGDNR